MHESPTEPVTGLGFREPLLSSSDKAEREHLYLFIVTTNRVLSYLAAGKGSGVPPVVVNEVGCGLGCAAMDHRTREMAIARDEAIYMCKPDGLGACYAIECNVFLRLSHAVFHQLRYLLSQGQKSA